MSKNTVDIANDLLAEKAALEARVKELELKADHDRIQIEGLIAALDNEQLICRSKEAELARLKEQEPVGYTYNRGIRGDILAVDINDDCPIGINLYAEPRPAVLPDFSALDMLAGKFLQASVDRAGRVSSAYAECADMLAKAVKALRDNGCQPQRFVVKLPEVCWYSGANYDREEVIEAIRAAGGEIAE